MFEAISQSLAIVSAYFDCYGTGFHKRVSMGWCLLRLSAKILALLRLSVNFFQLRLTKKLKINFFCVKELINLYFLYLQSKIKVLGSSRD